MIELTQLQAGETDRSPKSRSIVVAAHGWLDNDPAVDHAVRLARAEVVTIHLVAFARTPLPITTTEVRRAQYDTLVERAVTAKMSELAFVVERLRRNSIDARAHVRLSDSPLVIREIAQAVHADLILIAGPTPTRRRSRAQRELATLLAASPIPVLVVPNSVRARSSR